MNLGSTIKKIRKEKGLTQKAFALECDITQTYLSQIESNQKEPNLSTLKSISAKLKVPLPILFFLSMTEEDVQPEKRAGFNHLSPSINSFLNEFFKV